MYAAMPKNKEIGGRQERGGGRSRTADLRAALGGRRAPFPSSTSSGPAGQLYIYIYSILHFDITLPDLL